MSLNPSDQRYTPDIVLDLIRQIAPIGLDPCTVDENPVKARNYFTIKEDGKAQDWVNFVMPDELVFVNPPYSKGSLKGWMNKCAQECNSVNIVTLTPIDLGTQWGGILYDNAKILGFWKGRISFLLPGGAYDTGAKQPSLLTCWSAPIAEKFLCAMSGRCRTLIVR